MLPGAISAEGIASGSGSTFYASDMFSGDIFRGDIRKGVAEKFIDNPPGRNALGLRVDVADRLLFAAGGFDGKGYVYDSSTGATLVSYQFSEAPSLINDVALTPAGAWFTNSFQPELYFVPITNGHAGEFTTLHLSGPAAVVQPDGINNNGIQATSDGSTLVVSHSSSGALNVVNPNTGTSRTIDDLSLPNVDGILMRGADPVCRADLPEPDGRGPPQRRPHLRFGEKGDHEQPVRGAHDRCPVRGPACGSEREVRHRPAPRCHQFRGCRRRPLTDGAEPRHAVGRRDEVDIRLGRVTRAARAPVSTTGNVIRIVASTASIRMTSRRRPAKVRTRSGSSGAACSPDCRRQVGDSGRAPAVGGTSAISGA